MRVWMIALAALGCSDKDKAVDDPEAASETVADTASPGAGSDTGEAPEEEPDPVLLNGLYSSGFAISAVPGLVVPLQLEIAMSANDDGDRTIDSIQMRAANDAGEVSEVMSSAEDIAVSADGTLSLDWGSFVLPGPFSPTGGDVVLAAVMNGTILTESNLCGDVVGAIESFDMDLTGSTFGTIGWDDRILGTPSACEEVVYEDLPRLESCPDMVAGRTTDFVSAGVEREFELIVPASYDPAVPAPLTFVLHGIGSSIDAMKEEPAMETGAAAAGHILVLPQANPRGGTVAWDPIAPPGINVDIALFDDLLFCIGEQYTIDESRVHLLGDSLGGIFGGALVATRSEAIASASLNAGGFLQGKTEGAIPIPTLVTWGGVDDVSNGQSFEFLAREMLETLSADGHFAIQCDNGLGHGGPYADTWAYTYRFFADHPQGTIESPYSAAGLPGVFPDYCLIPE